MKGTVASFEKTTYNITKATGEHEMIQNRSYLLTDRHGRELPDEGLQLFDFIANDGDIHQDSFLPTGIKSWKRLFCWKAVYRSVLAGAPIG